MGGIGIEIKRMEGGQDVPLLYYNISQFSRPSQFILLSSSLFIFYLVSQCPNEKKKKFKATKNCKRIYHFEILICLWVLN